MGSRRRRQGREFRGRGGGRRDLVLAFVPGLTLELPGKARGAAPVSSSPARLSAWSRAICSHCCC